MITAGPTREDDFRDPWANPSIHVRAGERRGSPGVGRKPHIRIWNAWVRERVELYSFGIRHETRYGGSLTALVFLLSLTVAAATVPPMQAGSDTTCLVWGIPASGRASPLDSLTFLVAGSPVKVCYGRPSSRGRVMIGGRHVPYGRLWRTGANEPTMLHTSVPIRVAGIEIDKGTYSLYTIPGESEWTLIINASVTQWGHIASYDYRVRKQEVGKATIPRERPEHHIDRLTLRAEPANGSITVFLEWENTRIRIPIEPIAGP